MSSTAVVAFLDVGMEIVDRLIAWRNAKAKAAAEGREINWDDVKAVRAEFDTLLEGLDAAIAAAQAREAGG